MHKGLWSGQVKGCFTAMLSHYNSQAYGHFSYTLEVHQQRNNFKVHLSRLRTYHACVAESNRKPRWPTPENPYQTEKQQKSVGPGQESVGASRDLDLSRGQKSTSSVACDRNTQESCFNHHKVCSNQHRSAQLCVAFSLFGTFQSNL
ncbi:hypothetical protein RRG08_003652 [Elysia crispata]|uniref:Uncharacterized protein n=1 Tax=Elysia crispata TaxID=231223 RepID=A0AAE1AVF6_9GAST|nr:hypothetical protein RRG08_003652 [Elysia crispata]